MIITMLSLAAANGASVKDFGAVGDGRTDDTRAIQAALDTGQKVLIPEGVFLLTNALEPMSDQEIEIVGTLKVADSTIALLTADLVPGQPRIQVSDAKKFYVGQWVSVGDENLPIQKGGRKVRREAGECGRIIGIEGNSLVLALNFKKAYSVAAQARVASAPSAILIEDKSNVHIRGTGIIDANKAKQFNFAPGMMEIASEETRAGCGISVHANKPGGASHITIEGVTVRNAILHNISFYGVSYSTIRNVTCIASHDKNILLRGSEGCLVQGNTCLNSEWEDGIILYSGNNRCIVQGNVCMGNRRQGICVNASQVGISLSGNICADNASNYFLRGDYSSSNGDISSGGGAVFFMGRGNTVTGFISKNTVTISATNFFMNGGVIGGQAAPARQGAAADDTPLKVGMVIERPNLDRRVALVQNVRIEGVQFVGCKTAVRVGGVVENVRFTENRFGATGQAVEIGNECREQVFFARNEGHATENRGTARIAGRDRTVTVAHGLNVTPALRDIVVTPANDLGLAKKFWASRPTKTGFEIHVDTEPGENGADFVWQVSASKDQPTQ